MLKAALTGGIGSGKSTVSRTFHRLGCPTLDLDVVSSEITAPGQPALEAIATAFGPEMIGPGGDLQRARLASVVFQDPAARLRLEGILHPLILAAADAWIERQADQDPPPPVALIEVPLLFEAHLEDRFDRIILVTADPEVRIRRLVARGLTEEQARARIAAQLPEDLKRARSHFIIENNGSLEELEEQVRAAWQALRTG